MLARQHFCRRHIAVCRSLREAVYAVSAATIVLPEPTSPSKRRDIGLVLDASAKIWSMAFFWADVRPNGRPDMNFWIKLGSAEIEPAFSFSRSILFFWRSS